MASTGDTGKISFVYQSPLANHPPKPREEMEIDSRNDVNTMGGGNSVGNGEDSVDNSEPCGSNDDKSRKFGKRRPPRDQFGGSGGKKSRNDALVGQLVSSQLSLVKLVERGQRRNSPKKGIKKCFKCGATDHLVRQCQKKNEA